MESTPNNFEHIKDKGRLKELESSGQYLFHGTPSVVDEFEPRQAYTDVDEKPVRDGEPAVFASSEIETPLFCSIVNKAHFEGAEGELEVGFSNHEDTSDYAHANQATLDACRDKTGVVHVFKKDGFVFRGNHEWTADKPVKPVAIFESTFDDIDMPIQRSRPIQNEKEDHESELSL